MRRLSDLDEVSALLHEVVPELQTRCADGSLQGDEQHVFAAVAVLSVVARDVDAIARNHHEAIRHMEHGLKGKSLAGDVQGSGERAA